MVNYVLDACALVALLKGETGAIEVNNLFLEAAAGRSRLYMSIVNLLEVLYGFISDLGVAKAQAILRQIDRTPLAIIDTISAQVYHEAARIKGTYHRLSLADSVGIATAGTLSAAFVTADHHELEAIEKQEHIPFYWFR